MPDCPKSCAMFPWVTIRFQNDSRLYQLQVNLAVNFEFYFFSYPELFLDHNALKGPNEEESLAHCIKAATQNFSSIQCQ